MISLGNIEIADLRLGASQVKALYLGSLQAWSGEEPGPDWLCFTAEEANSTVHFDKKGSPGAISIETSTDGNTWTDYSWTDKTGDILTLANVGDKVYFRAKTENTTLGDSLSNNYKFSMTGKIAASGSIQTLLKADGSRTDAPAFCFMNLFEDNRSLTTAPELPATTLALSCYWSVFKGCSLLTSAPKLPAKNLATSCYQYMFLGSSITAAPALPATTLANNCYMNMFSNCTSLTSAPALPATTLASGCYFGMFNGCTSLMTAPELPATTLASNCYFGMFQGCTSLTTAPVLPAMTLASLCYLLMFSNCSSLTTAPVLPAMTLASLCYYEMFSNCSSLTTAPALPAMTLAILCYLLMFKGCSSLSSVEVAFTDWTSGATSNWLSSVAASGTFTCPSTLPDTRGISNIPEGWTRIKLVNVPLTFTAEEANSTVHFDKKGSSGAISIETSINGGTWTDYTWSGDTGNTLTLANVGDKVYMRAKTENQTIGSSTNFYYKFVMTGLIAASGNIQTLLKADGSRTDAPEYCYANMFSGCSSLTTTPDLPATTLGYGCYYLMFRDCSSLTTASELPATILNTYCYYWMFGNCTSLTQAPVISAMTLDNWSCMSMFFNCTSMSNAVLPATTFATGKTGSYIYMFNNCSSLSSIEVGLSAWPSDNTMTENWVLGVAASGTFICPAELPDARGNSRIPSNWTKVDAT